ncbi:MAG: hypothetical protein K2Q97_06880, partial [Burkholderiaceae bacterium]|nr:hypothetical protein [Burkholderiaceae bacterium]
PRRRAGLVSLGFGEGLGGVGALMAGLSVCGVAGRAGVRWGYLSKVLEKSASITLREVGGLKGLDCGDV